MTGNDLDKLDALCAAAPPGPYSAGELPDGEIGVMDAGKLSFLTAHWHRKRAVCEYAAAAMTAVPELVRRVRELETVCRQAGTLLNGLGGSDELGDFYAAEVDRVDDLIRAALAKENTP